jgi:hypothetical protein
MISDIYRHKVTFPLCSVPLVLITPRRSANDHVYTVDQWDDIRTEVYENRCISVRNIDGCTTIKGKVDRYTNEVG